MLVGYFMKVYIYCFFYYFLKNLENLAKIKELKFQD
jgi:hypothetical protein